MAALSAYMARTLDAHLRTDRNGNTTPDCGVAQINTWGGRPAEELTKDNFMCSFFGAEWKAMGGPKWSPPREDCRSYNGTVAEERI